LVDPEPDPTPNSTPNPRRFEPRYVFWVDTLDMERIVWGNLSRTDVLIMNKATAKHKPSNVKSFGFEAY